MTLRFTVAEHRPTPEVKQQRGSDMAATCLSLRPSPSSSFMAIHNTRASPSSSKPHVHVSCYFPLLRHSVQLRYHRASGISTALAVAGGEAVVAEKESTEEYDYDYDYLSRDDDVPAQWKNQLKPCELYVCNLPRSCDIPDLMEMFKPFGTVLSVEVTLFPILCSRL